LKKHLRVIVMGSLLSIPLLCPRRAAAQLDPWEFEVYPYATEQRGMIELESDNAVVANGHSQGGNGTAAGTFRSQGMWYNGNELTYGSLIGSRPPPTSTSPSQAATGFGGRATSSACAAGFLMKTCCLSISAGMSSSEWHKRPQSDDTDLELELKPIVEKDFGRLALVANPVFEKVLLGVGHDHGFEFGYRNGIYYRWMRYLSPGVEFYGGIGLIDDNDPLSQQQHYIFPVIWGEMPHGIEYSVGPGFGLTTGSDHVIMKFNLELERFVGAIFGPSPDTGWFF
jgi:hypothetical protein